MESRTEIPLRAESHHQQQQQHAPESSKSLPEHLRRPSLPPPTGPLPPTPQTPGLYSSSSYDRLGGRPYLPSSSLPLWTASTKNPEAALHSTRVRGPSASSPVA